MGKWKVNIRGIDPDKTEGITLEMDDVDELINQQLILTRDYMDSFRRQIETQPHYGTFPNVKRVIAPDGTDMTNYQFSLILAVTKDMRRSAILIAAIARNEYKVMAIWPPDLAEICREDASFIKRIMVLLSEVPDFWKSVYLLEMM